MRVEKYVENLSQRAWRKRPVTKCLVQVQIQIAEGKAEKQETFKLMLTLKRTPRLLSGMVRVVGLEMEMEMVWGGLLPCKPPQFCRHSLAGVIVWPLEGNRPGRQRVLCEAL